MQSSKIFFLLFLGSALVLAQGDELPIRQQRGFTNWLSGWFQKVQTSAADTIEQERNSVFNAVDSVKGAIGNIATASVDALKVGWNFSMLFPKMGLNILTKDDTKQAIRSPIQDSKDALKKAIDSMKQAVSGSFNAGINTAKATWDLTFIFPKFGLNLFAEQKEKLETALQETYEQEKSSINNAIQAVLQAGGDMANVGQEMIKATWDLTTVVPRIAAEIIGEDEDRIDEILKTRLNEVEQSTLRAIDLVKKAGEQLANAGIDVAKAGFDLGTVIPKYGFNLLSDDDKKNLENVIKGRVAEIQDSLDRAVDSVRSAVSKIDEASKSAAAAGFDFAKSLPEISTALVPKSELESRLNASYKQATASVKYALDTLKQAGNKMAEAGKGVAEAGIDLALTIPKFGYGLLGEQKELFDETVLAKFNKQKESMDKVLESVKNAGKTISEAGREFVKSSWDAVISIPKFGYGVINSGFGQTKQVAEQEVEQGKYTADEALDILKKTQADIQERWQDNKV